MTDRLTRPNTASDVVLQGILDARRCFVMTAGAGSGKTTSLVKALDYIARTHGAELKRRGQRVACVTYTEVAVDEIWSDVGNAPLFQVSTIHSFLWELAKPFPRNIQQWVRGRIQEKIDKHRETLAKPRAHAATKERAMESIASLERELAAMERVHAFTYGTGSNYSDGILGHDDVLRMGPELLQQWPLLRQVVSQRFPFIFVDESQDTAATVVEALKSVAANASGICCVGFFGDAMQRIYTTGVGAVAPESGWESVTKPENFRCPQSVLDVVNSIRRDADGLAQTPGHPDLESGAQSLPDNGARLFIGRRDGTQEEQLKALRQSLATTTADDGWLKDGPEDGVRVLVLVHRMAAERLGFAGLYAALHDDSPTELKEGLVDGGSWPLKVFVDYLLPLTEEHAAGKSFEVMQRLRRDCPRVEQCRRGGADTATVLAELKRDIGELCHMLARDSDASIREVCEFVRDAELADLDSRMRNYLESSDDEDTDEPDDDDSEDATSDEGEGEAGAIERFLDCPASELAAYRTYITEQTPFVTQQGIKGAEFPRVLVIIEEEATHFQFSYSKYFGMEPLSPTDRKNAAEGKDNVVDRTRRLFYVCCSRARLCLAVVLFVSDVPGAIARVRALNVFKPTDVGELVTARTR